MPQRSHSSMTRLVPRPHTSTVAANDERMALSLGTEADARRR